MRLSKSKIIGFLLVALNCEATTYNQGRAKNFCFRFGLLCFTFYTFFGMFKNISANCQIWWKVLNRGKKESEPSHLEVESQWKISALYFVSTHSIVLVAQGDI